MTALRLAGKVAASIIRNTLDAGSGEEGFARFLLASLADDEILGVVAEVRADAQLASRVEILLPRYRFEKAEGVPADLLTDKTETVLRHLACEREGRVMVLTDESQRQSLAQLVRIDSDALLSRSQVSTWIDAAGGIGLDPERRKHLELALTGILDVGRAPLRQFAAYVLAVADRLQQRDTVELALGSSLMALRIPRHDHLFDDLSPARKRWQSTWRDRLLPHWRRSCYFAKRDLQQLPLPKLRLAKRLEQLQDNLPSELIETLRAYAEAPEAIGPATLAPFAYDWSQLEPFFEELPTQEKETIGRRTLEYYERHDPELLTQDEWVYVRSLAGRRGVRPTRQPEDEQFYRSHSRELQEDSRLSAMWERFIYGQRVECTDLVDGIVQCLRRLYDGRSTGRRVLVVEGIERFPAQFSSLNEGVCRAFERWYSGLPTALNGVVEFRSVRAFKYSELAGDLHNRGERRREQPTGKKARQLTFKVWLESIGGEEVQTSADVRLVWECELDAVGIRLDEDLERLADDNTRGPVVKCVGGKRSVSRSRSGVIDLSDTNCLEPELSRDRGSFVPRRAQRTWIDAEWKANLERMKTAALITAPAYIKLLEAFRQFYDDYKEAISDLRKSGLSGLSVARQAASYGSLLSTIAEHATTPLAVDALLHPLLEIGVASVEPAFGHAMGAIICPWHPIRLAGLRARWLRLARSISPILADESVTFTDNGALFFGELRRDLQQAAEPDVLPVWDGEKPVLLARTDHLNGYSLHERAITPEGGAVATGDSVKADARQISAIVETYLKLQPHERDNLSVVLYNSDAAALPQAVVDSMRDSGAGDGEAMCQVMLRHTDGVRLRELYRQLVSSAPEQDVMYASESTRDFMSRLRISMMINEGPTAASAGAPPCDIVFCHDVVARRARLDWRAMPRQVQEAEEFRPGEWSRRIPIGQGEHDSVALLARPVQPQEGWSYLHAVASLFELGPANAAWRDEGCLVPVRKTDIRAAETRDIIDETHRLGNWVVNIDSLLDRRQLQERGITVIRYKKGEGEGRNLIISSKASDTLLRATIESRIRSLDPSYGQDELARLAARLVTDANAISGDLVLRAARRGSSASELIGVVLSRYLVDAQLGTGRESAWVFLDDYANWLGQDEERIADLLCLSPHVDEDGVPVLDVVVTEAKFVGAAAVSTKAKESARQLADTLLRLERALDPENAVADRRIWRARLTEMLVDGLRGAALRDGIDWATVLRDETRSRVRVRGYSHVFGHAPPDALPSVVDAYVGVAKTGGRQERYSPDSLREILRAYCTGGDPMPVRRRLWKGEDLPARPLPVSGGGVVPSGPPAPLSATSNQLAVDEAAEPAAPPSEEPMPPGGQFLAVLNSYAAAQGGGEEDGRWLEDVATRCTNALMRYGMSARLIESVLTPNAALLKYRGADDLTIGKVENRTQELETTHALKVLNVRAQPGKIVISIERPNRARLTLANVWKDWAQLRADPSSGNNRLLIALLEDDGTPLFLVPQPAPHTLVAGSTGSGKSVLVQNIIVGIAATNTPAMAQIVLIDPKAGVDYFAFEDLPHLQGGIVSDTEEALARLEALVAEMERRYLLFRDARTNNVEGYNKKHPGEPLPTIWVVHDEFADWMQIDSYRAVVESVVSRLGVKARAAGIYLIFAAQRPDNTVFPMQLRSNLGNRLVLKVDSPGTSDLSLGQKGGGAEKLLGQGHLAALIGGASTPQYAQVPFVDEAELTELVNAIAADDLGRRA
ncbi:FtsK/SpoIIIE domain-containing protein [Mesorhizobium sp. BAC0120]|uniref:FtsK/SpoIIIE domain-containing protein n=1 Tax=Mesorhizobium sp. BAC0120 TaxID=3090670 RepID=UPI00298D4C4B|nr:FtsK/SpoIIIE domain-containing protein [Mesorhizobium sp. BAC0120]MDW6023923.1 FtsK/SpoIIIE domain-containing protein [Mesorhizobium sp. BAC0120]